MAIVALGAGAPQVGDPEIPNALVVGSREDPSAPSRRSRPYFPKWLRPGPLLELEDEETSMRETGKRREPALVPTSLSAKRYVPVSTVNHRAAPSEPLHGRPV